MGRSERRKGADFELDVCKMFATGGLEVRHTAQQQTMRRGRRDAADVTVAHGKRLIRVECKNRADKKELPDWLWQPRFRKKSEVPNAQWFHEMTDHADVAIVKRGSRDPQQRRPPIAVIITRESPSWFFTRTVPEYIEMIKEGYYEQTH